MFAQVMQMSLRRHRTAAAFDFEGREVTYGELDGLVNQVARSVGRRLRAPDPLGPARVAILMQNCPEWMAAYLGIARAGGVIVPLNIRLTPAELAEVLIAGACRVVLYHGPTAALATEACRLAEATAIDVGSATVLNESEGDTTLPASDFNRIVALPFTSGTTGAPKGVVQTAGNLLASMINGNSAFGFVAGLANLVMKPLFFHPVTVGHVLSPLYVGGKVVLYRNWDTQLLLEAVASGRVGFVTHVPTTLMRQLSAMGDLRPPTNVRYFVGAAPLHEHVLREAIERLGTVFQGWGMNECTNIVACTNFSDYGQGDGKPRWSRMLSCGHPLPNSEVAILTEEGQQLPLAPGVTGEALVRGPITARGYWNNPEEHARTFRNDWVHTGDIIEGVEGGCLRVIGRRKELIISGAMKVAPPEVEAVIQAHPAVDEVAVFGTSHAEWGEMVTAAIILKPGCQVTAAEIEAHCRAQLAGFKVPRRICFVDDFPRNPAGKTIKGDLRRQYEASLSES